MKLNLGCGESDYREGWVNVDCRRFSATNPDVVHDLNSFPYPFKTGEADEILMSHVLEHLEDPVRVMDECHRILKPGGKLTIITPHPSFPVSWADPTHRRPGFSTGFANYFDGKLTTPRYTSSLWKTKSARLVWRKPGRKFAPIVAVLAFFIETVANWYPPFAELYLWHLVGGFAESRFEFEALK